MIILSLNCMKPTCWVEIGMFRTKLFMSKLINRNQEQTEKHRTFFEELKFDDRHRFILNLSNR